LDPRPGGLYVDATLGGGGHAEAILERVQPGGRLIGLDWDDAALAVAAQRLQRFGEALITVRENFAALGTVLAHLKVERVDGILFDLGASTMQFADPERGFSFGTTGSLDMRMDRRLPSTAADYINRHSEREVADVLWRYGQERWSRRIARAIYASRPIRTTTALADVVAGAIPRRAWPARIHPATRTFQALRIAVNDELANLEQTIPDAVEALRGAGRLCAITFHSLEDHIVKHTFLRLSRGCTRTPGSSTRVPSFPPKVRVLTRKPVTPSLEEVRRNPRARSAKLRVAERLDGRTVA